MKNKTKLIYSNYDPETGISIVRIQSPEVIFKGKARVHPSENDIASSFAGCKYAEIKAYIKYFKNLKNLKQYAIKEITKLYNQLSQRKDIPDVAANYAWTQLEKLKQEKQECEQEIIDLKKELDDSIKMRSEILKRIKKGKF